MKKLIVLSGLSFMLSLPALRGSETLYFAKGTLSSQEVMYNKSDPGNHKISPKRHDVSYQSKEAFKKDFENATILNTKRSAYFDEIEFEQDHVTKTAFYDADSKLVATTQLKTFSDLPVKAQHYINSKYPGYTIAAVLFADDNEFNESDMVMYNRSFSDADNYFVELVKGNSKIVVKSDLIGYVDFFKSLD
ncbi:MAG: hypothetical protein ABI761_07870 [Saprospiraceae bacterium]